MRSITPSLLLQQRHQAATQQQPHSSLRLWGLAVHWLQTSPKKGSWLLGMSKNFSLTELNPSQFKIYEFNHDFISKLTMSARKPCQHKIASGQLPEVKDFIEQCANQKNFAKFCEIERERNLHTSNGFFVECVTDITYLKPMCNSHQHNMQIVLQRVQYEDCNLICYFTVCCCP